MAKEIEKFKIDFIRRNRNNFTPKQISRKIGLGEGLVEKCIKDIEDEQEYMSDRDLGILEMHHTKTVVQIAHDLEMDAGEVAIVIRRWI